MSVFRAYVYVVVGGVALVVAVVFAALQWGSWSVFSAFGPEMRVRTVWFVLICAGAGVVLYGLLRLMVRGALTLHEERRRERRILDKAKKGG